MAQVNQFPPVYAGAESMNITSKFAVLSEQNVPQGPFSMGNTLSVADH